MPEIPHTILISRTDAIGDVILTLPITGILKEASPKSKIIFLGMSYTRPVIKRCKHVDEIICWNEISEMDEKDKIAFFKTKNIDAFIHVFPRSEIAKIAKKAQIPQRFGTTGRIYNWIYCNRLVSLSRKKSNLHEAQLNAKLIKALGAADFYSLNELAGYYGITDVEPGQRVNDITDDSRFNLILHPKSKGSAREWGLENFEKLIEILPEEKYNIIITGTADEGTLMEDFLKRTSRRVKNLTGKLSLDELISLIGKCDGLVAASTGPLHIAAMMGIYALGIYPPIRPMHPGRWAPIGNNAHYLVKEKDCDICRKEKICSCIKKITPEQVKTALQDSLNYKAKFDN